MEKDKAISFEKINNIIYDDSKEGSRAVAEMFRDLIIKKNSEGKKAVLGLATGSSPVKIYEELVKMHKEEGLSFKEVITFNLDEYFPMKPEALQSYVRFMWENLFDHVDILPENVHIPNGTIDVSEVVDYCKDYERKIKEVGGIDIQLLGIGRTGHIGFNEPGSNDRTNTRLVTLDRVTRVDAAEGFSGEQNVPRKAITMGVNTIMKAKKVVLVAWGTAKSLVVHKMLEGPITDSIPASYLQNHPNIQVVIDTAASEKLTRFNQPWLIHSCDWQDKLVKKAVVWLCDQTKKPILKLTDEDYNEHGLSELITGQGPAYKINIRVFNML
ncbi:MAG: glucosamine-6-phosphate deaminase, partial [Cyclobacteriaceae bacterium]|nr:glucosamine-6-phosphate deaminase [Cyclobacteriaceae bacterium]